jgi:NADPH-dependent 2,4-dienoyl-CoA reductase/sulfur reductase-like enzyme
LLETIVVVGASLAGLRCAEALRRLGHSGRLVLIGAEARTPYDRPPLSKDVLRGARAPEAIALVKPDALAALALDLRLGRTAASLDLARRAVVLEGGEEVRFDGLVIATGATPRALPGTPPLAGIHVLRTLDDCLRLRGELERHPRVAVVGAGFIGAEVAATCRQRGLEVTLLETLPVPLGMALPPAIGETLAAVHRDQGVTLRCGVRVTGFEGSDRVGGVRLDDGTQVPADVVVVGIGVTPQTGWLAGSGLAVGDGVLCDETLAAGAPDVVAAGDVARWTNPLFGESMRIEHWTNAVEQGTAAAERLLAGPAAAKPFAPVPFVWSDHIAGRSARAGPSRRCWRRPRAQLDTMLRRGIRRSHLRPVPAGPSRLGARQRRRELVSDSRAGDGCAARPRAARARRRAPAQPPSGGASTRAPSRTAVSLTATSTSRPALLRR